MQVSQNTIRTRAYELWEQQGRPIGRDLDHWWQAEQELGAAGDFDAEGDAPLDDPEPDGASQPTRRGRTNA